MIKETTKKIHFQPYTATKGKDVDTSSAPTVNLNRNTGIIWFGKVALQEMGMDGKFVRFYFEPTKKIIGWQVSTQVKQTDMKIWRLVKPYTSKTTNMYWTASLKKLVRQIPALTKNTYSALPVQKYREINPLSEYKNEVFYFVELVDNPEALRKGVGNSSIAEMATA